MSSGPTKVSSFEIPNQTNSSQSEIPSEGTTVLKYRDAYAEAIPSETPGIEGPESRTKFLERLTFHRNFRLDGKQFPESPKTPPEPRPFLETLLKGRSPEIDPTARTEAIPRRRQDHIPEKSRDVLVHMEAVPGHLTGSEAIP